VIKEILGRHVTLEETLESNERDEFLTEKLHIPAVWIQEAKVRQ